MESTTSYKYDVFISYSRLDNENIGGEVNPNSVVSQILKALDEHHITYWIDIEGIYTSNDFVELIGTKIEESRTLLFISSEHSNASIWTPREIASALEIGHPVLPFRIDKTPYNKSVRLLLTTLDFIDYPKLQEKSFPRLIESLQALLIPIKQTEKEAKLVQEEVERKKIKQTKLKTKYDLVKEQADNYNQQLKQILQEMSSEGMTLPEDVPTEGKEHALIAQLQKESQKQAAIIATVKRESQTRLAQLITYQKENHDQKEYIANLQRTNQKQKEHIGKFEDKNKLQEQQISSLKAQLTAAKSSSSSPTQLNKYKKLLIVAVVLCVALFTTSLYLFVNRNTFPEVIHVKDSPTDIPQIVDKKYTDAAEYYLKLAEQGDAVAQNIMGYLYEHGYSVKQDYNEAVKWYRKAAEQGYAEAQNNLGNCYHYGRGVTMYYQEAAKWYRKAAEQGYTDAQYNLGDLYYMNCLPKNNAERNKWLKAAAEQGHIKAQNTLGYMYLNGDNYQESAIWYRMAAKQGSAEAQLFLGHIYSSGGNGIQKDSKEAAKWYELAANQNCGYAKYAQYALGLLYEKGDGVPQNKAKAIELYRQAAKQNHEDAIKQLKRLGESIN